MFQEYSKVHKTEKKFSYNEILINKLLKCKDKKIILFILSVKYYILVL